MSKYIKLEDLMKFPIRLDHYDKKHGDINFIYGIETVLEYAENLQTADTIQEWISVKDRLPDKTGRYLVLKNRIAPDCLGGNRTDIVILRFFVDKGFRMPTHIPDWINEEINDEVTHWMPLPKPPKGAYK